MATEAYIYLKSVVGKIEALESFILESVKRGWKVRNWKIRTEVYKVSNFKFSNLKRSKFSILLTLLANYM